MSFNLNGYFEKTLAGLTVAIILSIFGYFKSSKFRLIVATIFNLIKVIFQFFFKIWKILLLLLLISLLQVIFNPFFTDNITMFYSLSHFLIVFIAYLLFIYHPGRTKSNKLKYNFNIPQDAYINPEAWTPHVDHRGIEIIPHNNLTNVLTLIDFQDFSDGVIECCVFLTPGSLFNLTMRGTFGNETNFYMTRVDSRSDYFDCILYRQGGAGWRECNQRETLKHHSHSNCWINMKVILKRNTIFLYRDNLLVDKYNNALQLSGSVGFFAERGNAYLRSITITPFNQS